MTAIILVGVLGTVISVLIGSFWYSGATPMGRWHMQYLGLDKLSKEELEKKIAEATPEQLLALTRKWINPQALSFFRAGDFRSKPAAAAPAK